MRPNDLKQRLAAGETVSGAWLLLGSPDVAEVMALAGFGALIIDFEHSPYDGDTALAQLRAIRACSPATVLARPAGHDVAAMQRLLDAGFDGLVLPNVRTGEEARRIVRACSYPPHGGRGAAYTLSRAANWGMSAAAYLEHYREELLLFAMIEDVAALPEIGAIAAVDRIDGLFIGPLDLSATLGCMGRFDHPDLQQARASIESAILASGRWLAGALLPGESVAEARARGYSFVTATSDAALLRQAAVTAAAER